MKTDHIIEALVGAIENKIIKEWRHEGLILGWNSEHINFDIDGKKYVLRVYEVCDGEH